MIALVAAAGPVIPNFGGASKCVRDNRFFCWSWVQGHWGDTLRPALVQHIELTLVSVAAGFVIAFTIALLAYRHGWIERPFGTFAGVLYTIPSIALFELLIPVTGLTRATVEIPLATYTLLVIFRNTLIGLREVPEEVRESARGMGFTRRQILWRVELPIALPAVFAGVRVAMVTVISLATIGAYVVDQGLGSPIFKAIGINFTTEIVAAGVLAILLAFSADGLLVLAQRTLTPWARRGVAR